MSLSLLVVFLSFLIMGHIFLFLCMCYNLSLCAAIMYKRRVETEYIISTRERACTFLYQAVLVGGSSLPASQEWGWDVALVSFSSSLVSGVRRVQSGCSLSSSRDLESKHQLPPQDGSTFQPCPKFPTWLLHQKTPMLMAGLHLGLPGPQG